VVPPTFERFHLKLRLFRSLHRRNRAIMPFPRETNKRELSTPRLNVSRETHANPHFLKLPKRAMKRLVSRETDKVVIQLEN
jgi:hypothetical protein